MKELSGALNKLIGKEVYFIDRSPHIRNRFSINRDIIKKENFIFLYELNESGYLFSNLSEALEYIENHCEDLFSF